MSVKQKVLFLFTLMLLVFNASNNFVAAQEVKPTLGVSITNLYDAFGDKISGTQQDFGFSCIISYNGKTILFDAGTDVKVFEHNVKALKINLKKVDIAIISHGHYDHIGGFDYLLEMNPKVKIYLPNDFFSLGAPIKFPFKESDPNVAKTLPKEEQYFSGEKVVEGMITVPTGRFWKSNVEFIAKAKEVLPGLTLIPTTSALMGTYIKYPPFDDEHPQFIGMPELSASFDTEKGAILISGCSHSTIEAIIQEAKKIGKEKIYLVLGGFHLIPYNREYIEGLAKRMHDLYGVQSVAPVHCTGHMGFSIFHEVFGNNYKYFGLGETLNL